MTRPAVILLLLKRVDCNDGVASYLESLTTGLRDKGDRVVIVSGEVTTLYGSGHRRQSIQSAAVEWVVLDGANASRARLQNLRLVLSVIRRHSVDVISPQGFSMLPLGWLAGRIASKPVVTNFHLLQGHLSFWQRLNYRFVINICRADRYIAMSREISAFFREQCGIPAARIHEQVLGVDTAYFRPPSEDERRRSRSRFNLGSNDLVSVLPARLNLTKGHGVAAAAFRILRRRRPDLATICLCAGGGDERDVIEADVLRDDADHATFRFLDFVTRETMRDCYWACDIVLLPSTGEGFPLVLCEAMCCGAIVVRTPSSGWREQVIEGKTGYVVPFNDPSALAVAIEKIADAPDRLIMRQAATELASSKFSRSTMVDGTYSLYHEVLRTILRSRRRFAAADVDEPGVAE